MRSGNHLNTAPARWSRWWPLAALLAGFLLAGSGCRVVQETARFPVNTVKAVVPGEKSKPADPAVLQAELQRYAVDFAARTASGLDEYARGLNTPEARTEALRRKLALTSSVLIIASGPNPRANLLDFLALASLTRTFVEKAQSSAAAPDALQPLLEASRHLETNVWKLAQAVLTTNQQAEFRTAITRWSAQNAQFGTSFFLRPQDFAAAVRESAPPQSRPESVFSLVGLDPTASLDPAVREVTRTRLFAERALFAAELTPTLMRWQVELLGDQFLGREQVSAVLQSAERLSRAAESASQTAAALPARLSAEREAVLQALDTQEGKLRELSGEVGRTLAAGEKMSTSLNTTLVTFDGLLKRFGVGEPAQAPPKSNAVPFNILDYGRTAEQVGAMAQQVDLLLRDASGTLETPALDKPLASLRALSSQARADARSVLNHAFLLVAGLLVMGFGCAWLYRRFVPRGTSQSRL